MMGSGFADETIMRESVGIISSFEQGCVIWLLSISGV